MATILTPTAYWEKPTKGIATGYVLSYGNKKGGPYPTQIDVGNVTKYKLKKPLKPSRDYYFVVRGYNKAGHGPDSEETYWSTFENKKHKVTVTVDECINSSINGQIFVKFNDTLSISFSKKSCCDIKSVKVNGESKSTKSPLKLTRVNKETKVVITATKKSFSVYAKAGSGGKISPNATAASCGGSLVFQIKPNTGYKLNKLTDNGVVVTNKVSNQGRYTLSNISEKHDLVASFKKETSSKPPTQPPPEEPKEPPSPKPEPPTDDNIFPTKPLKDTPWPANYEWNIPDGTWAVQIKKKSGKVRSWKLVKREGSQIFTYAKAYTSSEPKNGQALLNRFANNPSKASGTFEKIPGEDIWVYGNQSQTPPKPEPKPPTSSDNIFPTKPIDAPWKAKNDWNIPDGTWAVEIKKNKSSQVKSWKLVRREGSQIITYAKTRTSSTPKSGQELVNRFATNPSKATGTFSFYKKSSEGDIWLYGNQSQTPPKPEPKPPTSSDNIFPTKPLKDTPWPANYEWNIPDGTWAVQIKKKSGKVRSWKLVKREGSQIFTYAKIYTSSAPKNGQDLVNRFSANSSKATGTFEKIPGEDIWIYKNK